MYLINHQKRIYKEEQNDAIFRSEYGSFMAIADILDAIYEGEINSGYLKNENGDKIPRIAGCIIAYVLLLGILFGISYLFLPTLLEQVKERIEESKESFRY